MRRARGAPAPDTPGAPGQAALDGRLSGFHNRLKQAVGTESQNAFARRAGIPQSTLSAIWRGGEPTLSTLTRISVAAGVSLTWLALGEEAESKRQSPVATGKNPVLDHDTLKVVIEEVERHLATQRKTLAPDKKAELVSLAYSLAADTSDLHEKESTILRLVKLAG